MRHLALCAFLLLPALAADSIEFAGRKWTVPVAADWKVEDGVLHMLVARPQREPRRPTQFALAGTPDYGKVTVECEAKRLGGSLIIVYAFKDATHFNYAHLSVDTGVKQPVHNGIFHVYGGERVRISSLDGPAAMPSEAEWYRIRLDWDGSTGLVTVKVNGNELPALRGVDLSLTRGKAGIGSFFETALFRNVKITGTPAK